MAFLSHVDYYLSAVLSSLYHRRFEAADPSLLGSSEKMCYCTQAPSWMGRRHCTNDDNDQWLQGWSNQLFDPNRNQCMVGRSNQGSLYEREDPVYSISFATPHLQSQASRTFDWSPERYEPFLSCLYPTMPPLHSLHPRRVWCSLNLPSRGWDDLLGESPAVSQRLPSNPSRDCTLPCRRCGPCLSLCGCSRVALVHRSWSGVYYHIL